MIKVKRIYEKPEKADGYRILVDRLWPRGVSKDEAQVDLWIKEIGPSTELRQWFGHDPAKWAEFRKRYAAELKARRELVEQIKRSAKEHGTVTLLYSAKDEAHNNAVALQGFLKG